MNVSAIIPTYNRQQSVLRAIASALDQTRPPAEVIIVDDGSTDGTAEAIESCYGSRVRLFRQKNQGVSAARNLGVRQAQGEWVAFLDSDDFWLPSKLQRQLEALRALGSDFGASFTNATITGDPAIMVPAFELVGLESRSSFDATRDPTSYVLAKRNPICIQSLLVQRALLVELGGFDQHMFVAEDTDLLFRLTFKTRFCSVAEPLVTIDRSSSRAGLGEVFDRMDDRTYACLHHMYNKWLNLPEVVGTDWCPAVTDQLRQLLYSWAVKKLYRLDLPGVLEKLGQLSRTGLGGFTVLASFVSLPAKQATRRLRRSLVGRRTWTEGAGRARSES